ncbi:hypothetical protein [Stenotrophomonas lactitubi]|uniref:hypothetical protein n=1 Tax=Stenotrophomonas lactitubi TaxID=2045214 RepID=UPI003D10C00A
MEISNSFGGVAGGAFVPLVAAVVEGEGVVVQAARGSSSANVQIRRTDVIRP